jgi:peptidylprolyl isomerase
MSKAKSGDTVKVHYTGKLSNGTIFDSSEGRDPLQFVIGANQVIPGFEKAVEGMAVGDKEIVDIPVNDAYGPVRPELVSDIDKKDIPDDIDLEVGKPIQVMDAEGNKFVVMVIDITDSHITLDGNHPLAGKDLTFDIELMEIV